MKSVEFLYFYLMPETPYNNNHGSDSGYGSRQSSLQQQARRTPSKKLRGGADGSEVQTKTIEEKQALLGRYLSNVEDLVEDLRESIPFGAASR